jgi:ABC-type sulfate transport system permease subunit
VVIVAGNIPLRTQTAAVYVFSQVESENRLGASAVSIVLVLISFAVLLIANTIHNIGGRIDEPGEKGLGGWFLILLMMIYLGVLIVGPIIALMTGGAFQNGLMPAVRSITSVVFLKPWG